MNMLKNRRTRSTDTIKNTISSMPRSSSASTHEQPRRGDRDRTPVTGTISHLHPVGHDAGLLMFGHRQVRVPGEVRHGVPPPIGMVAHPVLRNSMSGGSSRRPKRYLFSGVDYFEIFDLWRTARGEAPATQRHRTRTGPVFTTTSTRRSKGGSRARRLKTEGSGEKHSSTSSWPGARPTVGGRRYVIWDSRGEFTICLSLRVYTRDAVHLRGFETGALEHPRGRGCHGTYDASMNRSGQDRQPGDGDPRLLPKPAYKAMENPPAPPFK